MIVDRQQQGRQLAEIRPPQCQFAARPVPDERPARLVVIQRPLQPGGVQANLQGPGGIAGPGGGGQEIVDHAGQAAVIARTLAGATAFLVVVGLITHGQQRLTGRGRQRKAVVDRQGFDFPRFPVGQQLANPLVETPGLPGQCRFGANFRGTDDIHGQDLAVKFGLEVTDAGLAVRALFVSRAAGHRKIHRQRPLGGLTRARPQMIGDLDFVAFGTEPDVEDFTLQGEMP